MAGNAGTATELTKQDIVQLPDNWHEGSKVTNRNIPSLTMDWGARLGKVSFDSVRALERYSVALKRLTFNLR